MNEKELRDTTRPRDVTSQFQKRKRRKMIRISVNPEIVYRINQKIAVAIDVCFHKFHLTLNKTGDD